LGKRESGHEGKIRARLFYAAGAVGKAQIRVFSPGGGKTLPSLRYALALAEKSGKRHTVADVIGNLPAVTVHAVNIHDTKPRIPPAREAFE